MKISLILGFMQRCSKLLQRAIAHVGTAQPHKIPWHDYSVSRKWFSFNPIRRGGYLLFALVLSFSLLFEAFAHVEISAATSITSDVSKVLADPIPRYANFIEYNARSQQFEYNKGYQPSSSTFGVNSAPQFSGSFPIDGSDGIDVIDPASGTTITVTPKFNVGSAIRDVNRLVYPLPGRDAIKVISIGGIGYKEDIVLNSFQGSSLTFSYDLTVPNGVEARLEPDGSVGFYGVQAELLGSVTAGSEADAELLEQARTNGEKNTLLFKMPAPYVVETNRQVSQVETYFTLEDSVLTTHVNNLRGASYPLAIDPSVYVETARKFMRGNNESNVDFDVDNELFQKASTTGARFNTWAGTTAMNQGLQDGASAVAGGYIYHTGGAVSESGGFTQNSYTSSTTFTVPAGVTSVTVKAWGGGGGGGAGGTSGVGGSGGGGGYASGTFTVTPSETLNIDVGGAGGGGSFSSVSGSGGGGGGHSEVRRSSTVLVLAPGGGGGGGGDNSTSVAGGAGGAGGDETSGLDGGASSTAGGGFGASGGTGGGGGTGGISNGTAGASEAGGAGGNNGSGTDGNAGANGGAAGGTANTGGWAGGGGGGGGLAGGGGGSASASGDAGGGGGGGGTASFDGAVTSTVSTPGSGTTPGNSADGDRAGAGNGGSGGGTSTAGSAGSGGIVVISYTAAVSSGEPVADVQWANINDNTGAIETPNPGSGVCSSNWCSESVYDLPDERRGHSMVAYNGFLYVFGGLDDTDARQSTVYIAKLGANGEPSLWHPTDSNKNNWVYWYQDTALPEAISYTSVVAYNNRLYMLGGSTDASPGGITTVRYTDLEPTGELSGWTTTGVVAMSTARFQHSAEVYNGFLYVVGGDSSSSGALLNTVEVVKLAPEGSFSGSWRTTSSFSGARRTNGGDFTTIYGAYLYLAGGCTAVSGGLCQTVGSEIQIASIFADGSLGDWSTDSNTVNDRASYGLHAWQNYVYRVGGCADSDLITISDSCSASVITVDSGEINPPGEVSTVRETTSIGSGTCTSSTGSLDCDLPPAGDDAGEIGHMLNATVVLNGFLYVIGGCATFDTGGTDGANADCATGDAASGNVAYTAITSEGSLLRPDTCVDSFVGSWCVDDTNLVNGTTGVAAAGVTIFNNTIYIVGGLSGAGNINEINRNTVNTDGSLSGAWTTQTLTGVGATNVAYTYAYSRANPSSAGTNPGNLFIFGGCTSTNGAGCNGTYVDDVFKCNIQTSGAISGCTTSGQLQIDSDPVEPGNQGLGIHSGTVYANYVYLIGGFSSFEADKDDVAIARIDDNNDIVAIEGETTWLDSSNKLSIGRRRGWAFGYNGHIYSVGGYDSNGGGVLPFIEWSKASVSDGLLDPFITSEVTVTQRWGLSMIVSNSFAYVIGGCDVGASPSQCESFEDSIQVFQLYNNDSGAQAEYVEQTGNFDTLNSRIGSSTAIVDGYIYVAGGETSGTVTNNVQVAPLNADGTIGTWTSTTASLPAGRAYGQLEVAGGDLYYIGGEDTAGDEKSEVYYASPTTGSGTSDTIRTTTYKIDAGEFTGTNYTLTLDQNLTSDYFVMVAGASTDSGGNNGPDNNQIRVDQDPFGNFGSSTSADAIRLARGTSTSNWVGTVTVVECVSSCTTDGFELYEVLDTSLASGNTSTTVALSGTPADFSNVVPFGAYLGGGLETTEAGTNFSGTAGVEVSKTGTNSIQFQRDNSLDTAAAAEVTTYVVEWGSNWLVQDATFSGWSAGGQGVDATGEYTAQAFDDYTTSTATSVDRDNTWVWKSPGRSSDDGLGRGSFGKVVTLGDGVNQNTTETTVALASENSGFSKNDTVYVMEHSSLATDYRFLTRSNYGTSTTVTVDSTIEPQDVSTTGNITTSAGYAVPLFYYTDSGNGDNYPKVAGWSNYHSNDTTISYAKSFSGNSQSGWVQSVDFGNFAGSVGGGDITSWSTASNGLPGDRTRHGAAVWNDRIYVVAGLNDSNTETNTVYVSPQLSSGGDITSAWTTNGVVPDVARSGGAVIAYANNLYLLGGNDGTNYLSDVQFASIGYKTGTIAQSGNTVTGTGTTFTSSMVGSTIQYISDGSTATITSFTSATSIEVDQSKTVTAGETYIIDDGSVGEWTFTTSLPQYVSDADGFAANGFMYLLGGRSAASTCTNNTYVAPISANTTIATGNNPTGLGEWYQTNVEYLQDRYSLGVAYNEGKVYLTGGGCGTEVTSNQHYIGTLRAQPQIARYSYFVDADTDVFPNAWLLNGLDNNIGARWQFAYRSSTDAANSWGQDTNFGDVTLGSVEDYIPVDGAGSNTNFARYFYVTVSIDASQTFGYPDDVSRGPTVDDMTIFFVSDPNKRLRHGKTFIQGVEQPLDTPPPGY